MVPLDDKIITILVNKDYPLDENFIPDNLVIMDQNENNFHNFFDPSLKPTLSKKILPYFYQMQKAAAEKGLYLAVGSGFRSYNYQQKIYAKLLEKKGLEYVKKYVAPPGASEHQTGLAFDVSCFRNGTFFEDLTDDDEEIKWLKKNSYKYGFILRYPKEKEKITGYDYEPWHFRFVGENLAFYLYQNNLTLEEYYLTLKDQQNIVKSLSLW